jgi:hypothetical protein
MGQKTPYTIKGNTKIIPSFITKPEQGSKSREFSELIHRDLNEDNNTLSFYICPCKRNQADQAENNFMKYNDYYEKDKNKIDVLHGEKQSSKDPDGFIYRADKEGQRLIISIVHKVRLEIVYKIIVKWINSNSNRKVKIYLDEAGEPKTFNAFINHIWSRLEADINRRLINVFPIFIDAHSKALLNNKRFMKYFPTTTVHKLQNEYNLDNYMFMSSMTYIPHEWNDTHDILDSITKGELEINHDDYILWPFPKVKYDQYRDAEEISSTINNVCVLDINGDGYHLYINRNGQPEPKITLPKRKCGKRMNCGKITCPKCNTDRKDEMSDIKFIKGKYAYNIPLILCGHDCIDRAMTYHEPGFSFTKAVIARNNLLNDPFSNCSGKNFNELSDSKQEKVSQMVKRISGSFKSSLLKDKNPLPIIFGPQDIYEGICKLENISTYIANQSGYLSTALRNNMDYDKEMLCQKKLLRVEDIENSEKEREPYDYYMVKFKDNTNSKELQDIINKFKKNIGGKHIQAKSIESRRKGVEPDDNMGDLAYDSFKNDISLLKTGLNVKTQSRFRVCKGTRNELIWIIPFQMEKSKFKWDNKSFNIISIEKDGNCLFNSFIKSCIVPDTDNRSLRRKVKNELANNKDKYDTGGQYDENDWDDKCEEIKKNSTWDNDIFDYCVKALSELLNVNVHVFNIEEQPNGGYEFINYICPSLDKSNNIYLIRTNDNHYDLMKIIIP